MAIISKPVTKEYSEGWDRIFSGKQSETKAPMTKEELIKILKDINADKDNDAEICHMAADEALIEFINDQEVEEIYDSIHKWYA